MLIDLRELLSGTKDTLVESVSLDMSAVDTGVSKYEILDKAPFELKIVKLAKNKVQVSGEGEVVLDIPCDRCLKSVPTTVGFSIEQDLDFNGDVTY